MTSPVISFEEKIEETPSVEPRSSHVSIQSTAEDESFYVDFKDGDKRNPVNFSTARKWVITIIPCAFSSITAAAASSYVMGYSSMIRDLNCTLFQASIGLSMFPLGVALVPLVTSSFSEEFGRFPFYIVSSLVFMLTEMMIALASNVQTIIVARLLGGIFGSTGATLVGGTIADIWLPHQRGFPMSLYALAVIASIGLGPAIAGWIEADPSLGWRWIQWTHVIFSGAYFVSVVLFMTETRSTVILIRMASRMRKDTGDGRFRARAEENKPSLASTIAISCTRPLSLLLTEPIIQSFSLWVGFIWGVLFILIDSISGEFRSVYEFGVGETGTVFFTISIGSLLGYLANLYQEKLYRKHVDQKGPEARLYMACVASVVLPIGMLIFAWTTRPDFPWIVSLIGLTLFMASAFILYQVVFVYLADCYGLYASSALAGQGLCRGMLAAVFPLFTTQMFDRMSYKWADTLVALIAVVMIPIPYILFFYGSAIRQRSPVSKKILAIEESNKTAQVAKS